MIFIYNYIKVPSIPKDLEPLSEYIKPQNKVLVADLDTFAEFIDEVYKKFSSVPKNEKYTLNLSDSSIAIYDKQIPLPMISICFSDVLGLWGFQTVEGSTQCEEKQDIEFFSIPDKSEECFSLPDYIKRIIKKGGKA